MPALCCDVLVAVFQDLGSFFKHTDACHICSKFKKMKSAFRNTECCSNGNLVIWNWILNYPQGIALRQVSLPVWGRGQATHAGASECVRGVSVFAGSSPSFHQVGLSAGPQTSLWCFMNCVHNSFTLFHWYYPLVFPRTSRFASFPEYLVVQIKKFTFGLDWVPKKFGRYLLHAFI